MCVYTQHLPPAIAHNLNASDHRDVWDPWEDYIPAAQFESHNTNAQHSIIDIPEESLLSPEPKSALESPRISSPIDDVVEVNLTFDLPPVIHVDLTLDHIESPECPSSDSVSPYELVNIADDTPDVQDVEDVSTCVNNQHLRHACTT